VSTDGRPVWWVLSGRPAGPLTGVSRSAQGAAITSTVQRPATVDGTG